MKFTFQNQNCLITILNTKFPKLLIRIINASAASQRLVDVVLKGMHGNEEFVYLDDIVIHSETLKEQDTKVRILFNRLREVRLKLRRDKCEFLRTEEAYLDHIISRDRV